eukprot:maker-scaffold_5-snap-gene-18.53-mRNA-1 protein AED:0.33 eAED:0.33 QI:89/1/1/1/0.66/0.5/4/100/189
MTLTPTVKWAQRKNSLFLTIDVPDIDKETAKIELTEKKLNFEGKSGEKEYKVEIDFLKEIDVKNEETKYQVKDRGVSFFLIKQEEERWSRLYEDKTLNRANVKVDFDKWIDSDEEDGKDFNVDGMEGMPGGMAGMPGMENMDMSKMMEQMKEMQGDIGEEEVSSGEEDESDLPDSDDEEPKVEETSEKK